MPTIKILRAFLLTNQELTRLSDTYIPQEPIDYIEVYIDRLLFEDTQLPSDIIAGSIPFIAAVDVGKPLQTRKHNLNLNKLIKREYCNLLMVVENTDPKEEDQEPISIVLEGFCIRRYTTQESDMFIGSKEEININRPIIIRLVSFVADKIRYLIVEEENELSDLII